MVKCLCKLVCFNFFESMKVVINRMIMWFLRVEVVLLWDNILNSGNSVKGKSEVVGMGSVLVI